MSPSNQILEPSFVTTPAFRIRTTSEPLARRFYMIDRAQIKAKEDIQREEDAKIFEAINAVVDDQTKEAQMIEILRQSKKLINAILELEL